MVLFLTWFISLLLWNSFFYSYDFNSHNMNTTVTNSKHNWVEPFARFGLSAKGFVYVLTGVLSFMAAFELGATSENDASNSGIFSFIYDKPFGKIILAVVALGLVCYAIWRFIEAIKDTENKGSDSKGMAKRGTYLLSGIAYAGLAFVAAKFLMTHQRGNGDSQKKFAEELLRKPFGQWLVAIVAVILICIGLWQAFMAISGKYKKNIRQSNLTGKAQGFVLRAGKVGYISRGIVWMIIGWLFIKAAWNEDAKQAGSTQDAFHWLKDSNFGTYLLAAVAAGLICYGIFMFVRARYQPIGNT